MAVDTEALKKKAHEAVLEKEVRERAGRIQDCGKTILSIDPLGATYSIRKTREFAGYIRVLSMNSKSCWER